MLEYENPYAGWGEEEQEAGSSLPLYSSDEIGYEPVCYQVVIAIPSYILDAREQSARRAVAIPPPPPATAHAGTAATKSESYWHQAATRERKQGWTLGLIGAGFVLLLLAISSMGHLASSPSESIPVTGSFGLDYVAGPAPADMKTGNVSFVCRYLSEDNPATHGKILTRAEAHSLGALKIAIVSNYEWTATRALEGYAAGVQDAQIAAAQHTAAGGPQDRPIYFSVDTDASGEQVAAYFQGVASVIGLQRTGAYGSYQVLKYLFDHGLITWGWQTYAWSYGAWEPRAQIRQYQNSMVWAGHEVDYDHVTVRDFGQWLPSS